MRILENLSTDVFRLEAFDETLKNKTEVNKYINVNLS